MRFKRVFLVFGGCSALFFDFFAYTGKQVVDILSFYHRRVIGIGVIEDQNLIVIQYDAIYKRVEKLIFFLVVFVFSMDKEIQECLYFVYFERFYLLRFFKRYFRF